MNIILVVEEKVIEVEMLYKVPVFGLLKRNGKVYTVRV